MEIFTQEECFKTESKDYCVSTRWIIAKKFISDVSLYMQLRYVFFLDETGSDHQNTSRKYGLEESTL